MVEDVRNKHSCQQACIWKYLNKSYKDNNAIKNVHETGVYACGHQVMGKNVHHSATNDGQNLTISNVHQL